MTPRSFAPFALALAFVFVPPALLEGCSSTETEATVLGAQASVTSDGQGGAWILGNATRFDRHDGISTESGKVARLFHVEADGKVARTADLTMPEPVGVDVMLWGTPTDAVADRVGGPVSLVDGPALPIETGGLGELALAAAAPPSQVRFHIFQTKTGKRLLMEHDPAGRRWIARGGMPDEIRAPEGSGVDETGTLRFFQVRFDPVSTKPVTDFITPTRFIVDAYAITGEHTFNAAMSGFLGAFAFSPDGYVAAIADGDVIVLDPGGQVTAKVTPHLSTATPALAVGRGGIVAIAEGTTILRIAQGAETWRREVGFVARSLRFDGEDILGAGLTRVPEGAIDEGAVFAVRFDPEGNERWRMSNCDACRLAR